ncbi:MAG: M48 family metallopeptidase [Pseudomonadota bacterium]
MTIVRMDRRELLIGLAAGTVVPIAASGCAENAALGRNQLILISPQQLAQLSAQTWNQSLQQMPRSRDAGKRRRLERVGQRIVDSSGLTSYDWEFEVFENDQVNAWVLPNGKVGFYSGMFDVIDNDDQIATVLGHEAGHVAGRHAAERASQQMASGLALTAVSVGMEAGEVENAGQWAAVLGAGLQFGVLLPYSRQHEYEADRLGVDYMAGAAYNPNEAVDFWQNMMARNSRGAPPSFLSTHPSNSDRMSAMQAHIRSRGYA